MKEEELIPLLRQGNQEAYRIITDQYAGMVFNTALSLLQQKDLAEDLTQDVFVEVFESIKKFEAKSSLKTWIYKITVRKSLDELKKIKSQKRGGAWKRMFGNKEEGILPEIPHFEHPGIMLENKEMAAVLFFAIRKLPENQKIAFTLHKVEQLSYQEISEIMQTSVSSVESLMVRARQGLQKLLVHYYEEIK